MNNPNAHRSGPTGVGVEAEKRYIDAVGPEAMTKNSGESSRDKRRALVGRTKTQVVTFDLFDLVEDASSTRIGD
jgi:hypothetical protein